MSLNLMQKLLQERSQSKQDIASLKTSKDSQTQLLLTLYEKLEEIDGKLNQLLSRPTESILVNSNNEQIIKSKPVKSESEPAPFIPTIDTENMTVQGNTTTSKTSKKSISGNVAGLKDLSGE